MDAMTNAPMRRVVTMSWISWNHSAAICLRETQRLSITPP
jgi:hypothetical protein